MKKTKVEMKKPIYLGMCILDRSKILMYNFYYNIIKVIFPNATLCYIDTDSLILLIPTEDFYEEIKPYLSEWFDTSKYPADHPSGIKSMENNMKIGNFKDEADGKH